MSRLRRQRKKRFRRRRRWPLLLVSLVILCGLGLTVGQRKMSEYGQHQSTTEKQGYMDAAENVSENISENTNKNLDESVSESGGEGTVENLSQESSLAVHFLDVGQGDCALLICDGQAMLIDAGDDGQGTKIQAYMKKQGIEKLEYLVLTHPDADHIGGAPVIITKFDIAKVFMTEFEKESAAYQKVLDALEYRYLKWSTPVVGSTYALGSAQITVLGPGRAYEDSNNSSLILLVQHGENTFLFTGDAEEEAEEALVKDWDKTASVDVLKLAHHGSKTSTGEGLLDVLKPRYAVISCGEGNSYGFPHAQPLNYLRERDIQLFRTDEQGSIVVTSDGGKLSWNCSPSTTWQVGEIKK